MTNPNPKIHAFMAHHGQWSRRQAESLITEGRVKVNGQLATIGQRIDPTKDEVKVDGQRIENVSATPEYWLVNKPAGIVSTASDEAGRKTVTSLVTQTQARLYPVGRMDQDSEGLILLTNDGDVAYRLTHPKFKVMKRYRVLLNGRPSTKAIDFLHKGVKLVDGWVDIKNIEIGETTERGTWLDLSVNEGRKHLVKRIMRRAGYEVLRLIRLEIGPLTLDSLQGQQVRQLTEAEAENLRVFVGVTQLR